jgi:uncharacterized membrane protein
VLVLQIVVVVLAGVLAGTEFIVRWGVQPALSRLDARTSLAARKSLITRMRVLVPALGMPTLVLAIVSAVLGQQTDGAWLRWSGAVFLVLFFAIAFAGTVPINARIDGWSLDDPPADAEAVIRRWELIDVFRSSAALVAFVLLVVALARTTT